MRRRRCELVSETNRFAFVALITLNPPRQQQHVQARNDWQAGISMFKQVPDGHKARCVLRLGLEGA
jgi:hypothetical protein